MELEETHDGFLNLDAFMVHMMAVYAEEQCKATDAARAMFLCVPREKRRGEGAWGSGTLNGFAPSLLETEHP